VGPGQRRSAIPDRHGLDGGLAEAHGQAHLAQQVVRAAYGANLDRLAAVKSKWDPENFFRINKNIAPRAVAAE